MKKMYIAGIVLIALAVGYLFVRQKQQTPAFIPQKGDVLVQAAQSRISQLEQSGLPLEVLKSQMQSKDRIDTFPNQKIFVVDSNLIFWQRNGLASDYSFDHVLVDKNQETVCSYADNFAGPMLFCHDESRKQLFNTIINNLDKSDLGLGAGHVELVFSIGN